MATDWEISRATGQCAVSGRTFGEGEFYYAALFESPDGMERRDYAADAWSGPPEGCICHWRGRVPVRNRKNQTLEIDLGMLTHLFLNLEESDSETRQQFRFVLALLLLRKRVLRFEQAVRKDDREHWQLRLLSDKSLHQVINPRLTDEQVARLNAQLTALLTGEIDTVERLDEVPAVREGATHDQNLPNEPNEANAADAATS